MEKMHINGEEKEKKIEMINVNFNKKVFLGGTVLKNYVYLHQFLIH